MTGATIVLGLGWGAAGTVGARAFDGVLARRAHHHLLAGGLRPGETARVAENGVVVHAANAMTMRARAAQLYASLQQVVTEPDIVIGIGVSTGSGARAVQRATSSAQQSLEAGDHMVRPDLASRRRPLPPNGRRTAVQIVLGVIGVPVVALAVFYGLDRLGVPGGGAPHLAAVLTVAIAIMALQLWTELGAGLLRRRAPRTPTPPAGATAIVVAYLPNEQDTVAETLLAALNQDYPGDLQVILAYNTPRSLPIEAELHLLALRHPNLTLLRVTGSGSKAENINAALPLVTGEVVGIFDADHRPAPSAFRRAWRQIDAGADVVQGRCTVRNGEDSRLAQLVACEFEQIYGISHPGRQRLHGFGVFGGSNGYWRATVLRRIRLRHTYLTEDIESSIRAVRESFRIVNDPSIVSTELAPVQVQALWRQRLRWAQGWLQVTGRHLHGAITSRELTLRQRCGLTMLLGWREAFPWLSALVLPTLAYLAFDGGLGAVTIPGLAILVLSWLTSPAQVLAAWWHSVPQLRRRWDWWLRYLVLSPFCLEARNVLMRVAVLKQVWGERHWAVTPRSSKPSAAVAMSAAAGSVAVPASTTASAAASTAASTDPVPASPPARMLEHAGT